MFYRFAYILVKIIMVPLFRIRIHGVENIPKNKKFIICANHKSVLDPIFISTCTDLQIHFLAKKELFENPILRRILNLLEVFPVDREGNDINILRKSIKLIKDGKTLCIFPEGTRVKEIKRENIKDGAGFIALKSKTDILAIEIISSYKPFAKTDLYIKEPVKIEDFKKLKSKKAMEMIMDETYEKLYEKHKLLRKV